MKWSQQKNTSKHNYFIGEINANHAQEGKEKKRISEEEYKQVNSILITKSKQCLLVNCFLNQCCSVNAEENF